MVSWEMRLTGFRHATAMPYHDQQARQVSAGESGKHEKTAINAVFSMNGPHCAITLNGLDEVG